MKIIARSRSAFSTDAVIILVAIALVGGFIAWIFLKDSGPQKTTREVALGCTTDMATQFHVHAVLKITVNEKDEALPAQIGIQNGCMNSLHTHDATGVIHIEAPEKRDFTLADFFAVWDKPMSRKGFTLKETVNGATSTALENTILHDGDKITLSYQASR